MTYVFPIFCTYPGGLTNEGGCTRAEAGEGQQAVPCLLHAHYHVVLGVQEGRNQLQAVALQHLNVQRHTLGVALHCPHLHTSQIQLIFADMHQRSCLVPTAAQK